MFKRLLIYLRCIKKSFACSGTRNHIALKNGHELDQGAMASVVAVVAFAFAIIVIASNYQKEANQFLG